MGDKNEVYGQDLPAMDEDDIAMDSAAQEDAAKGGEFWSAVLLQTSELQSPGKHISLDT